MIEGQSITLGGRDLVIAPANLKTLRAWTKCMRETEAGSDARFEGQIAFITAVLQRNHPEIDADFVAENVDLANVVEVMRKANNASGLVAKESAEGEAQAAPAA